MYEGGLPPAAVRAIGSIEEANDPRDVGGVGRRQRAHDLGVDRLVAGAVLGGLGEEHLDDLHVRRSMSVLPITPSAWHWTIATFMTRRCGPITGGFTGTPAAGMFGPGGVTIV